MDQFVTMSTPQITQKSLLAYAVETLRGEHLSLQSKISSLAVNHGPGRPTDSPWLLLNAVLITTNTSVGHLAREFSRLLWYFLTHGRETNAEGNAALHSFKVD